MQLSDFDFHLPKELIAQYPVEKRDQSRLMIVDRSNEEISEVVFRDLPSFLTSNDTLVFNDTQVIPARLKGTKANLGEVEFLLIEEVAPMCWKVLAKPGKRCKKGHNFHFSPTLSARVLEDFESSKLVQFDTVRDFYQELDEIGQIPLPPYIKREAPNPQDRLTYQTVYAKERGSIAAPTAGLHFTADLLDELKKKGVEQEKLTLHVGLGTFKPILEENLSNHQMHKESYFLSPKTALNLNNRKEKGAIFSVGTTTLRALESASSERGILLPGKNSTELFIQPGYPFKFVDRLLTNFHLPRSSLFILVSSFMGMDLAKRAYEKAIEKKFRFFSYGDAMLIL